MAHAKPVTENDDARKNLPHLKAWGVFLLGKWNGGVGSHKRQGIDNNLAIHEGAEIERNLESIDFRQQAVGIVLLAKGDICCNQAVEGIEEEFADANFESRRAQGLLQSLPRAKADSGRAKNVKGEGNSRKNEDYPEADRELKKMVDGWMNPHRQGHIRCRGSISTATKTSSGIGKASKTPRANRASRIEEDPRSET